MQSGLQDLSDRKSLVALTPLELARASLGARHFSIWLIPSRSDHDLFAKIIEDLAYQYSASVFQPHVTIYTGIYTRRDGLEEITTESVQVVQPISLIVQGIGFSDDFFKTLFVKFQDSPALMALSQRIRSRLQHQEEYDLRPHLNLLYKNMAEKQKRAIIERLSLVKTQVHFDGIAVVSPGDLYQGWTDVERWKVRFRLSLVSSV